MRANPFLITIALFSLLTTGLVAPVSSQSLAAPAQEEALEQAEGAVYSPWERSLERVPFFFHHDDPFEPTPAGGQQTTPVGFNDGHVSYEPSQTVIPHREAVFDPAAPEDKRVILHNYLTLPLGASGPIDKPTEFVLPTGGTLAPTVGDLRPSRDWGVYGIEADAYVSCKAAETDVTDVNFGIDLVRVRPNADGSQSQSNVYRSTLSLSNTATPYGYEAPHVFKATLRDADLGNWATSDSGKLSFQTNDWFKVRLYADTPVASECVLHYGSANFPSNVVLLTDTGSLSAWVEDRHGDYTEGLPSADQTSQDRRRMTAQIAQASAWPNLNRFSVEAEEDVDYQDRIWGGRLADFPRPCLDPRFCLGGQDLDLYVGSERYFYRWVQDGTDGGVIYDSRTGHNDQRNTLIKPIEGTRSVEALQGGLNLISEDFLYTEGLLDGGYHLEVYSVTRKYHDSPSVTVGLKGFTMGLVDSEPGADNTHEVLPGRKTVFLLSLENLGAQSDTVQLSTNSAGTGWKVELSTSQVTLPAATLAPGKAATEVAVTVTPDATRVAGASTTFTVTAQSQYPLEVPKQTLQLTTTVVSSKDHGVDLFANDLSLGVRPGQRSDVALFRAHNLGASEDAFIVEAKLPTNLRGWSASATPPGRLIHADSIADFGLTLNVPEDAVAGTTFQLPVTISRVSAPSALETVTDTVVLTVEVILEHGLVFSVPDSVLQLRDPKLTCGAPSFGFADSQYCTYETRDNDHTALYRLSLHNPGSVAETYTLRGDLERGLPPGNAEAQTPAGQSTGCDGGSSSNPKPSQYWRVRYSETANEVGAGAPNLHNRDPATLGQVVVPAGATVHRWVELGIVPPSPTSPFTATISCGAFGDYSDAGFYRVIATADSEPGLKQTINLFTERHDFDATATRGVSVEPSLDLATSTTTSVRESELSSSDQTYSEVRHRFHVRNLASEQDTLTVTAVNAGAGYTGHLEFVKDDTPGSTGCTPGSTPTKFICRNMGIMDERHFDLVIQPDAESRSIELGDLLTHSVTVVSGDSGLSDSLSFQTRLVGEAQFETRQVVSARNAHPGQDVALSFQVDNIGTRGDTYSIALLSGDADWTPRLSTEDHVFVPGQNRLDAYLKVQVPETATVGQRGLFVVQVDSADEDLGSKQMTFTVNVVAKPDLKVQGKNGVNSVLLERSGQPQEVHAEALSSTGAVGDPITLRVDRAKLPGGWSVSDPVQTPGLQPNQQGHAAQVTFHVTAPSDVLGTSSIPLVVEACAGTSNECTTAADFLATADIILNMQDDVGVLLSLDDPNTVTATLPGGEVVFPVKVQNAGLSPDVIELTNTLFSDGWTIRYEPTSVSLGPLESRVVDVIVSAPAGAAEGTGISFILFGSSGLDPSEFGQLPLVASIGEFDLEWSSEQTLHAAAPDETVRFVARVTNNGTLPDAIAGSARLATQAARDAYGSQVDVHLSPSALELAPGQSKEVVVTVRLGPSVGAGLSIPVEALFESIPDSPSTVAPAFTVKVLDYKTLDVDDDGIAEYAVDRNQDRGDGFEEFREPGGTAGHTTAPAQLVRFLSEEGRLRHTVKVTVDNETTDQIVLRIDGDATARGFGDGKVDLLLDSNGDGLPDLYWDPDDEHSSRLTVFKDINADGVPDYFVDTSGNGEFNAVYDLAQGTFIKLLVRDVDNDGNPDFVVDKNGNGRVDGDETVLFSRDGKLIQVTKVDVDGDGKLDDVFDTDGDGSPDYFVPSGRTKGVPIKVDRDLNEDGFLDWSYDANRDGRDDRFYDPVTQTGGHAIDTQAEFVRSLQQYWYVGALFFLVAALFVVLVAVTRR